MSDAQDRRAGPRSPLVIRGARCLLGKDVFFGYALNVSRGGLFVSSVRPRTPGEVCDIRFELPGVERSFACRARVAWFRPYSPRSPLPPGFGLEFLDLGDDDRNALQEWVERFLAEEDPPA